MRVRGLAFAVALLCLPGSVAAESGPSADTAIRTGLSKLGYSTPADGQSVGWAAAWHFLQDIGHNFGGEPGEELPVLRALLSWQEKERDLQMQSVFVMPPLPDNDRYLLSADGRVAITVAQSSLTLWNAVEHRQVREIVGHCCIAAADLSADGTLLAYAESREVRVVDVQTGQMRLDFDPEGPTPSALKFNLSSDALLVGYDDGSITISTLKDGETRLVGHHLPSGDGGGGGILSVGVSPDGSSAVSISPDDGRVKVWDIATGKLLYNFAVFPPNPDNQSEGGLDTYDKAAQVAFDSTGKSVLVLYVRDDDNGSKTVPTIQRLDLAAGVTHSIDPDLTGFAISAGGEVIAVSMDKLIGVLSAADLKLITSFPAEEEDVKAIDAAGKFAMVNHWNATTYSNDTAFYDLSTQQQATLTQPTSVPSNGFAVSGDDAYLAVAHGQLLAVSLTSGQVRKVPVKIPEGVDDPEAIDFSGSLVDPTGVLRLSSGSRIGADGDETTTHVIAIDPNGGSAAVGTDVAERSPLGKGYSRVMGPTPSSDGLFAASSFERQHDGKASEALVSVVDMRSYKEIGRWPISPQTKGAVVAWYKDDPPVVFSGTNQYILTGFHEPAISALEVATGKTVKVFKTDLTKQQLGQIDLKPGVDKRAIGIGAPVVIAAVPGSDDFFAILRGSLDFSIARRFSLDSTQPTVDLVVPSEPVSAAVSPDGSLIALGYKPDRVVVVNVSTGAIVSVLLGNHGVPSSLVFSPDGRRLYTSSNITFVSEVADGAFRVWDVASGALLTTTVLSEGGEWVTVTPEGFFTASPNGADILTVRLGNMATASIASVRKALERPDLVTAKLAGDPDGKVAAAAGTLDLASFVAASQPPTSPGAAAAPDTSSADAPAPTSSAAVPSVAAAPDTAVEIAFWNSIAQSKNVADFDAYLKQFPTGSFVALAKNRLAELRPDTPPAN